MSTTTVEDRELLLAAALAWTLRHLPVLPPSTWESGSTPLDQEAYEQNREAAAAILIAALGDRTAPLPEPADVVPGIFIVVDVPRPAAGSVPMGSNSSTPLHARKFDGSRVVGCLEGCPACAAAARGGT